MSISACRSRLTVRAGGTVYPVVCLAGREAFNQPFQFQLGIVVAGYVSLTSLLNTSALMSMTAPGGEERQVHGLVSSVCHRQELPDHQQLWQLEISSHLYRLQQFSDTRLLLDSSLPDIILETCARHGLLDHQLVCDWSRAFPARPTTLQAGESDFDFLARLCSRNGMLFWSDCAEEQEILHFADSSSHCSTLSRAPLEYRPGAGLDHDVSGNDLLSLSLGARLVSDRYLACDVSEAAPDQPLQAARELPGHGQSGYGTTQVNYGSGLTGLDDAADLAQLLAQIGQAKQQCLEMRSHAADLRVGRIVRIEAEAFGSGISGDYLIVEMSHRLRQYGGLGFGGESDCPYTNQVVLIPREIPWRIPLTPLPELPLTLTARIESKDLTAQLDSAGRTRYRQHNDSHPKPFSQNSIMTRRLQPSGGPGNGHQPGWYLPQQQASEVLVSCLNNDPDRPLIVGTLPNPANQSPVTSANNHQNRLRTAGDQELCLDDQVDAPVISLRTFAGHNLLHLNAAKAEHLARLASEQGLAEFYAKQTMAFESGNTLTETIGHDRIQVVEDQHRTVTNQAEIHHQSATDVLLRGANNIELDAGQNIEFETGRDLAIDITDSARINVSGRSAAINLASGRMILQADGAININGDGGGEISIGQAGAGIKMDPAGNITLFGSKVDFQGAVSLNGKVNIDVTSPPNVSLASGVAASTVRGVGSLDYVLSPEVQGRKQRYQERKNLIADADKNDPVRAAAAERLDFNNDNILRAEAADYVYRVDEYRRGHIDALPEAPVGLEVMEGENVPGLENAVFMDEKSGFGAALFKSEIHNETMLTYRGTNNKVTGIKDWATNFKQGMGLEAKQYNQAMKLAKLTKSGLGRDGVVIVGHSLGGGLASAGVAVSGMKGYTFNAAGLHPNTAARQGGMSNDDAAKLIQAQTVEGEILYKVQRDGRRYLAGGLMAAGASLGGAVGMLTAHHLGDKLPKIPQAIGQQHRLDGQGWNPVSRHLMDQVIAGIEAQKQDDIRTLKG